MKASRFENYIDIFDGGPTMTARTDHVRTIRDARDAQVVAIDDDGGEPALVATGRLRDFRCAYGKVRQLDDGGVAIDPACAARTWRRRRRRRSASPGAR